MMVKSPLRLRESGCEMTPINELDFSKIRVLDGGMATELERRGCDISGPLWSAHVLDSSPQTILAVHLDYLRAGADCISTVSYQISAKGYSEIGRAPEDAAHALQRSVAIAEAAKTEFAKENARRVWIAASLGPYGAALHNGAEYHGNYSIGFDDLVEFHARRLEILAETNADLIAFETIPSLEEAQAIVKALAGFPNLAAWIAFTCKDASHVAHGERIAECASILRDATQVSAIGINCTPPHLVTRLMGEIKLVSPKPVIVYPNSGEVWDAGARTWLGSQEVQHFGEFAREWFLHGAQAAGGCCRTGPEHIRRVRQAFESIAISPSEPN
jgi:homocysteine S-methyltransferase